MKDTLETGPSSGGLAPKTVALLCANFAFVQADEAKIRQVMGAHFRAHVPQIEHGLERDAIARERKALRARIMAKQQAERALEPVIIVVSNEEVCEPHWIKRLAGRGLGLFGVAMLIPIPIVVAAGMAESDAISMVTEKPLMGLLYGIAPVGAAMSIHGLKECFRSKRVRQLFDLTIYGGALMAAGAWATLFGPTFLADAASGFGAAAESDASLATWYTAQLAMEFLGGAACLNAASHLLTSAHAIVSQPNKAVTDLHEAVDADLAKDRTLAAREDDITPTEGTYEAACDAFEARCLLHVETARKLLAAQAAVDANAALATVRETMITTITEGETNA